MCGRKRNLRAEGYRRLSSVASTDARDRFNQDKHTLESGILLFDDTTGVPPVPQNIPCRFDIIHALTVVVDSWTAVAFLFSGR